MGGPNTGREHNWKVRLVLFVVAFVCMTVSTVINFALEDGGFSAYLSLVCVVILAVAVADSFVRWRRSA